MKTNELLITILARCDEIVQPIRRGCDTERLSVYHERQAQLWKGGLPWLPRGRTGAERKADERELSKMETDGLVKLTRQSGAAMGVRLTDKADQVLRAACGLPGLAEALPIMRRMQKLHASGCHWRGCQSRHGWIAETDLSEGGPLAWYYGQPGWVEQWTGLQVALGAVLARGWVTAHVNSWNHAFYCLTSSGEQALADKIKPAKGLPVEVEGAYDIYETASDAMREELHTAKPAKPNDIALPLPCSWPGWAYPTDPLWKQRHEQRLSAGTDADAKPETNKKEKTE